MADTEPVIQVKNLVKQYGPFRAVDTITFQVEKGEIFGLLGENGAGKTTTLEIIEGLRRPSEGTVRVLGHDVLEDPVGMKQKIGVQLQSSSYYHYLTLKEMLELFASFYGRTVQASQLLELVHLADRANAFVTQLSGGQRQRFSIVASLVNDPQIVFLDEPTTGLDPLARRNLWGIIEQIRQHGKTVVMTTHYLEEAELLCDRVAIMEKGKIIAQDKTSRLVGKAQYPYTIIFEPTIKGAEVVAQLERKGKLLRRLGQARQYEVRLSKLTDLDATLDLVRSCKPEGLLVRPASLEDLFIELTGKTIQEEHA